ncbi:hypothetical protein LIER_05972 [Lithospermum erythrorhizon]|uniref:GIR1-like zinc ribbon domain-containing protein n=1 Tax=Lithospermum erythrorhizon TaxID=34254 RepID=A0AAV3P349_LITER
MATEVSSLVRLMNGRDSSQVVVGGGKSTDVLVTRDLLGGAKELDLDLHVPSGWEKLLDINSGKVYLQRCNASTSSSSTSEHKQADQQIVSKLQDLNCPPAIEKSSKIMDDATLDLKLVASPSSLPSSSYYQSVCTLDKVKIALEKVEKESRKRPLFKGSPPSSNSSTSIKDGEIHHEDNLPSSFATGCPSCLMYVLISKSDPKCPRCNRIVPSPPPIMKKPRIDLNLTI